MEPEYDNMVYTESVAVRMTRTARGIAVETTPGTAIELVVMHGNRAITWQALDDALGRPGGMPATIE